MASGIGDGRRQPKAKTLIYKKAGEINEKAIAKTTPTKKLKSPKNVIVKKKSNTKKK